MTQCASYLRKWAGSAEIIEPLIAGLGRERPRALGGRPYGRARARGHTGLRRGAGPPPNRVPACVFCGWVRAPHLQAHYWMAMTAGPPRPWGPLT